jgi:hypothetical protein
VVWCGVLGLAAYGTLTHIQASRLVTIKGLVLTAQGTLAENARVTMVLEAGREFTEIAKDGKFSFEKVDISKEPAGKALLKARWQDTSGEKAVDLGKGRPEEVTVTLLPGPPPFREYYLTLNAMAWDQFLRTSQLPKEWEPLLAGTPRIIPNDQLEMVKSLVEKFSMPYPTPFPGDFISVKNSVATKKVKSISKKVTDKRKNTPQFIGVGGGGLFWWELKSFKDFQSLLQPLEHWSITAVKPVADLKEARWQELFRGQKISQKSVFFLDLKKFATREDLEKIAWLEKNRSMYLDFLLAVTEGGMPDHFCELEIDSNIFGETCDGFPSTWDLRVRAPEMKLRLVVIENISSQPIEFQNFHVRENPALTLRRRADDQMALEVQEIQKRDWFTPKILKSGEKIVVPLEITFSQEEDEKGKKLERGPRLQKNSRLDKLQQAAIPFPIYKETKKYKEYDGKVYLDSDLTLTADFLVVPAQTLRQGLQRPAAPPPAEREYIYGTSTKIDSLEIGEVTYAFRQFDPKKVILIQNYGGLVGSCPFVYTFESETGLWRKEGQILYGKSSKSKEGAEERLLTRFDGRVLLKEEEPELSFIDFLQVKIVSPEGRERTFLPHNPKLRLSDGDYLTLGRGEELEVNFPGASAQPGDKVYLVARGYYLVEQQQ